MILSPFSFTQLHRQIRRAVTVRSDHDRLDLDRDFAFPLLNVARADHARHVAKPVGQQISGTALAEGVFAIGEAATGGAKVDLQDLDVPVPVVHVLHTDEAMKAESLDDVTHVSHDLVVRPDDLRDVAGLFTDHPLVRLTLDAEHVDAQLGARKDFHDEEAFHALLKLEPTNLDLKRLGADLASKRVGEQVGTMGDLPEAAAVDPTRGLDTNALSVLESGPDFLHGLLGTDGFDAFRAIHAARHPAVEDDFVVDRLEGLILADGVHRDGGEVREVIRR